VFDFRQRGQCGIGAMMTMGTCRSACGGGASGRSAAARHEAPRSTARDRRPAAACCRAAILCDGFAKPVESSPRPWVAKPVSQQNTRARWRKGFDQVKSAADASRGASRASQFGPAEPTSTVQGQYLHRTRPHPCS
jgi:hypothetical protein